MFLGRENTNIVLVIAASPSAYLISDGLAELNQFHCGQDSLLCLQSRLNNHTVARGCKGITAGALGPCVFRRSPKTEKLLTPCYTFSRPRTEKHWGNNNQMKYKGVSVVRSQFKTHEELTALDSLLFNPLLLFHSCLHHPCGFNVFRSSTPAPF